MMKTLNSGGKAIRDTTMQSSDAHDARKLGTSIGDTITVGDIESSTGNQSNRKWTDVVRNGQKRKGAKKPLPPDQTNLVVTGVKLGTLGLQLAQRLANNDIDLCDWDLLTTRDDATFLTFKIAVKKADADKVKDPSIWPNGYQIRQYNQPKVKKRERNSSDRNKGAMNENSMNANNMGNVLRNPPGRPVTDGINSVGGNAPVNNMNYPGLYNGMQQFGHIGNISPDRSLPGTYNNYLSGTGPIYSGNIQPYVQWNGPMKENVHVRNNGMNNVQTGNISPGPVYPGIAMQDTSYPGNFLYSPSLSRPRKNVTFDQLGMDIHSQQS